MVAADAPPPGGALDDAELAVDHLAALAALADELLVLVGVDVSEQHLDVDDENRGSVAPCELHRHDTADTDERVLPLKGDEDLVGDEGGRERDDEPEAQWHGLQQAAGAINEATVARLVVLDGVAEREQDGEPGDDEAEGASLEARAGG